MLIQRIQQIQMLKDRAIQFENAIATHKMFMTRYDENSYTVGVNWSGRLYNAAIDVGGVIKKAIPYNAPVLTFEEALVLSDKYTKTLNKEGLIFHPLPLVKIMSHNIKTFESMLNRVNVILERKS